MAILPHKRTAVGTIPGNGRELTRRAVRVGRFGIFGIIGIVGIVGIVGLAGIVGNVGIVGIVRTVGIVGRNRELTHKCPIEDKMHNWAFQIGDWGLGNRLELVGIDCNRLERLE